MKSPIRLGILLAFLALASSGPTESDQDYLQRALEAQFLNDDDELKLNEDYQDYPIYLYKDEVKDWYDVQIFKDPKRVKRNWKNATIKSGIHLTTNHTKAHQSMRVKLSFSFPFFGRNVDEVIVTTAGAIITTDKEDEVLLPSHIAPLLTSLPPSVKQEDEVIFHDYGNSFSAQWTKHILHDDHKKQEMEVTIYNDGSMSFYYKNLLNDVLELANNLGYPIVIGLKDGFAVVDDKGDKKAVNIHAYPPLHFMGEKLVSEWTAFNIIPLGPRCWKNQKESDCSSVSQCRWCQSSELCLYKMEASRPKYQCNMDNSNNCTKSCPAEYDPVCGTDGVTYKNQCSLEEIKCKTEQNFEVAHEGKCSDSSDSGSDCTTICTADYSPVCGSDGFTYANQCQLESQNCRTGGKVVKAKDGSCHDNDDNNDVGGGTKADDQKCEKACTKELDPVCINDDQEFSNKCLMEVFVCLNNIDKYTWQTGKCEKSARANSKTDCTDLKACTKEFKPICASNNETYVNECVMNQILCSLGLNEKIHKVHSGSCRNFQCPPPTCTRELRPVCGSDGRTYDNRCMLESEAECRGAAIKVESTGPCDNPRILVNDRNLVPNTLAGKRKSGASKVLKAFAFIFTLMALGVLIFMVYRMYARPQGPSHHQLPVSSIGSTTGPGTLY